MPIVFGAAGVWIGLRRQPPAPAPPDEHFWGIPEIPPQPRMHRGVVAFYVLTAAVAFWTTLGPSAGLYTVLYDTLPVFLHLIDDGFEFLPGRIESFWVQSQRRPDLPWFLRLQR